jgi:methylglutaconyl-CoA hydratase
MMFEAKDAYLKVEKHSGITSIEFFHAQGNSLPGKILEELANEIHSASHDENSKVIILRSGGEKAFCGGASFDELISIKTEEQGLKFFSRFAHLFNEMRKCSKFIVARVQGRCVGGGLGIAAAADYAIAVEGAEIKLSELAMGIGPFVVGPPVERKMGLSSFSQLAIDATLWRNADWARRKGIYAELHQTVPEMDESIHRMTQFLSHCNPEAMAEMKKMFWAGTETWDKLLFERAAISGKLVLSDFSKNAMNKFKKK